MTDTISALAVASVVAAAAVLTWAVETRVRALRARPAGTAAEDAAALEEQDATEFAALMTTADLCESRVCPDEMRVRYHAVRADGSRRCWTCGCETPAEEAADGR
ncbi:hypothetical protein [Streptomyces sp. NPDC019937]|uniref:hypothetical protein n=1 Tax=Streptomyces sp. NPDC019937 TaxID=3154787 RepID=UPI0033CAC315